MTQTDKAPVDILLRLSRLEAENAIRKIVGHYAFGADRRNDPEIMFNLFTEDAVWEAVDFGRFSGRDEIAQGLSDIARSQVVWSIHYMISTIIDLSEDALSGRCRWYLWELSTMRDAHGAHNDNWLGGWYDAQLTCEQGVWRFSKVVLDIRIASPVPVPWEGKKPFDAGNSFGQP